MINITLKKLRKYVLVIFFWRGRKYVWGRGLGGEDMFGGRGLGGENMFGGVVYLWPIWPGRGPLYMVPWPAPEA